MPEIVSVVLARQCLCSLARSPVQVLVQAQTQALQRSAVVLAAVFALVAAGFVSGPGPAAAASQVSQQA